MQERTYLLYTNLKESDGVKMSKEYNCPVDATISKIGGKYKAVILYHLENCTLRYNEIRKRIPSITDKMLAQQLRELENDNLIIKKIYPVIPPKTEYSLSELGKTLVPILDSMCEWDNNLCPQTVHTKLNTTEHIIKSGLFLLPYPLHPFLQVSQTPLPSFRRVSPSMKSVLLVGLQVFFPVLLLAFPRPCQLHHSLFHPCSGERSVPSDDPASH